MEFNVYKLKSLLELSFGGTMFRISKPDFGTRSGIRRWSKPFRVGAAVIPSTISAIRALNEAVNALQQFRGIRIRIGS
jgi:hypothetical protein